MKLNFSQLDEHLSKKLAAIYLISGDDPIQKLEAMQMLRRAARTAGFTERVRLAPESVQDEDTLYTTLHSSSLMSDKNLLELDYRSKAPTKPAADILEQYAANPSPDNLVIIDTAKLDDSATRSSWYKTVEKNGIVVTIWPVAREQLPQWIISRARKYKMNIQHEAASLLADYVEGNLTAAAQAIEKIYLLKHDKAIDAELIQSILADESRYTVFDLAESMITTNKARTLHILETLRLDGTESVLVLWGITRELRILTEIALAQQQGLSWDEIFKKHRIFSRRQQGIRGFLSRFGKKACQECLVHAADIDRMIKGGSPGNSWDALQLLCLRLV
jgi:DNA polymerase-3 subunit delta